MAVTTSSIISATGLGSTLNDLLNADDIVPGSEPGYAVCKALYVSHPLAAKIVESPVRMAMSQERIVTIEDAPGEEVKRAFTDARARLRADYFIRNAAYTSRIYGVGTLACGTIGQDPGRPLDLMELSVENIYFVVFDALNTAGSVTLNQDPNNNLFQKVGDIVVAGKPWHRSRACVLFNGPPIYLQWVSSAYGFAGRSVFTAALYPMKSFIRTLISDDMVATKSGLLIAFMKAPGAIVNALVQRAAQIKRLLLREAQTGNVLTVDSEDRIESVNLENVDKALITARGNIIKNIATAVPMPAQILEQESFAQGFGEGSEDTKSLVRFVNEVRDDMAPLYDFSDVICQRAAWSDEFCEAMRAKYPGAYGGKSNTEMFYTWKNNFKATWPNLLEEPESKKAEQQKVQVEGLIAIYQTLAPRANPEGLAALGEWVVSNLNEFRQLYPVPLSLDPEGLTEKLQAAPEDDGASGTRPTLRLVRPAQREEQP